MSLPEKTKPTLFLDRNFGNKIVPEILKTCEFVEIKIHDDHYPHDAQDPYLLKDVGKKNWYFVSKDDRIRYNQAAKSVILEAKTGLFILAARGNLQGKENAEIILRSMKKLLKFINSHERPFIAKITRDGNVIKVEI